MKEDTKYAIIVYGFLAIIFGLALWGVFAWIASDNNKLNICAEEYGYELRNKYDGGQLNVNYTDQYFNQTHIACCKRETFISGGEVKKLNCTSLHFLGEKRT